MVSGVNLYVFCFTRKTAYELRISDWSSDVCSSDLSCEEVTERLEEVTHLVYAAVNETPGDLVASWTDPQHAARNGAMFTNLLDPLTASAKGLRHVGVVHGTKAYATHLAKDPPVPMRESLPRPPHDDFYFRQEDALRSEEHTSELQSLMRIS